MAGEPRYALYFAPDPASELWRFGSAALGYDAATGEETPMAIPESCADLDWRALTDEPRRYGFHATLKAPFRLAEGQDEAGLMARAAAFTASMRAPVLDGLQVSALGSFIALTPLGGTLELAVFAQQVVEAFEDFRAPLNAQELAKRLRVPLTPEHQANLDRYGYPYVGAAFRFHMTLTGALEASTLERVLPALSAAFARQVAPGRHAIDRVALFRQDAPDRRFRILRAFLADRGASGPGQAR